MTSKSKAKAKPKASAKFPENESVLDARGHKQVSRKGKVHAVYDAEGDDVAFTLGRKLGLKEGTLMSWFGYWRRAAGKSPKPGAEMKVKTKIASKPAETTEQQATVQ